MQGGLSSLWGHPICVLALRTPGYRKGGGWVVIKMPGQAPTNPIGASETDAITVSASESSFQQLKG